MPLPRPTIEQIIARFHLQPLPEEGGLFVQSYCSPQTWRTDEGNKPLATAILYLLTHAADSFSALHRLPTDEIYHFYLGDPLELTLLHPDGQVQTVILGANLLAGEVPQFVVPAGVWQGSRVEPDGEYALVGTTMSPGFTAGDYEAGQREALFAQYPIAKEIILALTRR